MASDSKKPKPKTKRKKSETSKERDRRIRFVVRELSKGAYKHEIKERVRRKFGKEGEKEISFRVIENYISEAKEILREQYGRSIDDHKMDAYSFYLRKRSDPNVNPRNQLRAQERIDKLLGLEFREEIDERDINVNIDFQGIMDAAREMQQTQSGVSQSGPMQSGPKIEANQEQVKSDDHNGESQSGNQVKNGNQSKNENGTKTGNSD